MADYIKYTWTFDETHTWPPGWPGAAWGPAEPEQADHDHVWTLISSEPDDEYGEIEEFWECAVCEGGTWAMPEPADLLQYRATVRTVKEINA